MSEEYKVKTVTVQELGESKTAAKTPKVKADGVWYFMAKDRDTGYLPSPRVGQRIDIRCSEFTMGDKQFESIESWRPVQAQGYSQQSAVTGPAPSTQPRPAPDAVPYTDSDTTKLISNVLAALATAGALKEPGQCLAWVTSLKDAMNGKQSAIPFSDPIPYGNDEARSKW